MSDQLLNGLNILGRPPTDRGAVHAEPKRTQEVTRCELCGEPMPPGEEMFQYHGYCRPCPRPPLQKPVPAEPERTEQMHPSKYRVLARKHAARIRREMCCPKDDPTFGQIYCSSCIDRDQIATILESVAASGAGETPQYYAGSNNMFPHGPERTAAHFGMGAGEPLDTRTAEERREDEDHDRWLAETSPDLGAGEMSQPPQPQVEASFVYWTLCEICDGHSWGDLLMELGGLVTDDAEDTGAGKKRSLWAGEANELAATDGYGWPAVVRLVGQAMREEVSHPLPVNLGENRAVAAPPAVPRKDYDELLDALVSVLEERPVANGEYVHLLVCSGDRRQPPGMPGNSCVCLRSKKRALIQRNALEAERDELRAALPAPHLDVQVLIAKWRERHAATVKYIQDHVLQDEDEARHCGGRDTLARCIDELEAALQQPAQPDRTAPLTDLEQRMRTQALRTSPIHADLLAFADELAQLLSKG